MAEQRDDPVFIYSTFESRAEAEEIGHALVAARLAACVNIFPGMVSIYEWQGQVQRSGEVAALIKTRRGVADQAMAELRSLHSYDTPAMLVIPTIGGGSDYCAWIAEATALPEPVR